MPTLLRLWMDAVARWGPCNTCSLHTARMPSIRRPSCEATYHSNLGVVNKTHTHAPGATRLRSTCMRTPQLDECTETTSIYAHLSCLVCLSISVHCRCCGWDAGLQRCAPRVTITYSSPCSPETRGKTHA